MASEISWMASMLKRDNTHLDAKHYGTHFVERGLDPAMHVFAKALFERNLMSEHSYFALTKIYEQASIAQSKEMLQTSVIVMLLPGEDLCQQRVLARSNIYDQHLSAELQSVQYNLYSELVDFYREKGFEVCVVYGEQRGVAAAQLLGELYCYINLRKKVGRFYSEPTENTERFKILRILKPLFARCVRTEVERATKSARISDDATHTAIKEEITDTNASSDEESFDNIRRELRWYSLIGDKSKVLHNNAVLNFTCACSYLL